MGVPALRFPEFVERWSARYLGELVNIKTGKKNTQDKISDGQYPFFVRSQKIEKIDTFSFDGEAILTAGDGVGVGKVFHYVNGKFDYHQRVYCLSGFRNFVYGKYIYEIFKNNFGTDTAKFSAKNSVDSVRLEMISRMKIPLPSLREQQKIADCLSSLDQVISFESQKITALQLHKKGLMQKVFPAEGKRVPELRFAAFHHAPEWEERKLSDISPSIFDGTHQTPNYKDAGIPFFSVENIVSGKENKFISEDDYNITTKKNKPEKGDILLTRIGRIGYTKVVDWDYNFSVYVTLAVIKKSKSFNSFFMHHFMQSSRYQAEIHGKSLLNAVPCKTNMESLRNTLILLPKLDEQKKIADTFSSLDELIATQLQKLNSLKAHKTGLMQQLFPAMDEVTG